MVVKAFQPARIPSLFNAEEKRVTGRMEANPNGRRRQRMFMIVIAIIGVCVLFGTALFIRRYNREHQKEKMRISTAELNQRIVRHDPLVILDLRHPLDVLAAPQIIPGAIPVKPSELDEHLRNTDRHSEIVLYCTCPNEETSLTVYRQLLERGFQRVKVLTGGLPAWKREKLQLQDLYPELEQQVRKRAAVEA
jgi:rhodanese-related sulfurtransferase